MAKDNNSKDSTVNTNKSAKIDIYYIAEKIIESQAELKHDSLTMIKQIIDTIGSRTNEIYCYYSNVRLIQVQNRIINEKGKDVSFMMFDFDENNSCFSVYRKESEKDKSTFYIYDNNSIIVHNNKMSKFLDDSIIRNQIIHEASIVLDSTMKLFPEFKYSFNWK